MRSCAAPHQCSLRLLAVACCLIASGARQRPDAYPVWNDATSSVLKAQKFDPGQVLTVDDHGELRAIRASDLAVSYTHLTLPTNREV